MSTKELLELAINKDAIGFTSLYETILAQKAIAALDEKKIEIAKSLYKENSDEIPDVDLDQYEIDLDDIDLDDEDLGDDD